MTYKRGIFRNQKKTVFFFIVLIPITDSKRVVTFCTDFFEVLMSILIIFSSITVTYYIYKKLLETFLTFLKKIHFGLEKDLNMRCFSAPHNKWFFRQSLKCGMDRRKTINFFRIYLSLNALPNKQT